MIMAIVGRVEPFIRKKLRGTPVKNLKKFVADVVYDPTPDNNAYLK